MANQSKIDVDLSIVIVSYNTKRKLTECLNSIYKNVQGISFEIIVSDNHSTDGSLKTIEEKFPQVNLIRNEKNLGFSKANNKALSLSKGNYALLLNSDTIVLPLSINKMMDFLCNQHEVGVVGAKLIYPDGTIQRTARHFPTLMASILGRKSILRRLFPDNKFSRHYLIYLEEYPKEPFEVDWVSGAAMMVKREVIEDVGLLDEKFFIYWEDADWCFRIKQKGWKVFCVPSAPIIHYEGESAKNTKLKSIIQFHKSAFLLYRKHYIKSNLSILNAVAALGLAFRALLICMINLLGLLKRS